MRLVELVAAPGAGKSVLAAAVLADRSARGWTDARRLGRRTRPGAGPVAALAAAAPGHLAARTAERLLVAPSEDDLARALTVLAADHPAFVALVAAPDAIPAGPEADDAVLRLLARRWFVEALSTRALIEVARRTEHASTDLGVPAGRGRLALLDEGLLHPTKLDAGAGADPERRARYLATVPLPDVVVAIALDAALVAERLRRRAAERPSQARLAVLARGGDGAFTAEAARLTAAVDAAVSAARARGATVVVLDGEATVATNVAAVIAAGAGRGAEGASGA